MKLRGAILVAVLLLWQRLLSASVGMKPVGEDDRALLSEPGSDNAVTMLSILHCSNLSRRRRTHADRFPYSLRAIGSRIGALNQHEEGVGRTEIWWLSSSCSGSLSAETARYA